MHSLATSAPAERPRLTGRKVGLIFAAFFGTIFCADTFLIVSAVSTYTGAETTSAYKAGQLYNAEIALARAQAARGWTLEPRLERAADGRIRVTVAAADREGRALAGRSLVLALQRPTDRRDDRAAVPLREEAPGFYAANVGDVAPGQWDLVADVLEGEERVHRRKARTVLR
jgi:nitrogen fixation protein FixH